MRCGERPHAGAWATGCRFVAEVRTPPRRCRQQRSRVTTRVMRMPYGEWTRPSAQLRGASRPAVRRKAPKPGGRTAVRCRNCVRKPQGAKGLAYDARECQVPQCTCTPGTARAGESQAALPRAVCAGASHAALSTREKSQTKSLSQRGVCTAGRYALQVVPYALQVVAYALQVMVSPRLPHWQADLSDPCAVESLRAY